MGAEDRALAREALDAVSVRHRALSAAIGAAASWAAAVAAGTQRQADDVAWRRTTADMTGDDSAAEWGSELRDYQPVVVWPQYAERLVELHDDLGTALLGPVIYKSVVGLAPANAPRTVKHMIDAAWREDRSARVFEGFLTEAPALDQDIWLRRQDWASGVRWAANVLEQTGFDSLWMRSTYSSSVEDRLNRAVQVYRDVYAALARSQFEPLLLTEWKRWIVPVEKAAMQAHGGREQDDVRSAIMARAALIIDDWIGSLLVGGVSESEQETTEQALEDQYPDAMTAWRDICAARVANGHPALQKPKAFYTGQWERSASQLFSEFRFPERYLIFPERYLIWHQQTRRRVTR